MLTVLDAVFFILVFIACVFDVSCRKAAITFIGAFFDYYRRVAGNKG